MYLDLLVSPERRASLLPQNAGASVGTHSKIYPGVSHGVRFSSGDGAIPGAVQTICGCTGSFSGAVRNVCVGNATWPRLAIFFCEGFLAARYGAAAKEYLLNQPWAMAALVLVLVFIVVVIRRLPGLSRTEYSQPD
jgi:uncharacterized membrane protein YfcA